MPIGYRVFTEIRRSEPALLKRFEGLPTPDLADCMRRTGVVSSRIQPVFRPVQPIAGPAVTISLVDGGFRNILKLGMDLTRPGDVLVVAGRGVSRFAMLGGNLCKSLKQRGVAGCLVDGAVRDLGEIRRLNFPLHARGLAALAGPASGPGEINVPVSFGGCVIFPGDILVADEEGIVVVPPAFAEEVLAKARELQEFHQGLQTTLAEGKLTGMETIRRELAEDGCEVIAGSYQDHITAGALANR